MVELIKSFEKDKQKWDKKLLDYATCDACVYGYDNDIWEYFKYCLTTQNRFFFKNPLLPIILNRFEKHTFILEKGTKIFRARIDEDKERMEQCFRVKDVREIHYAKENLQEEDGLKHAIIDYYEQQFNAIIHSEDYQIYSQRINRGFEGFDEEGSGSPPASETKAGRCNPSNVSFLYAAKEIHTAVAEVRPFIRDAVSVAKLIVQQDLRLVDFSYNIDEHGCINIDDKFFHHMRSEFSLLNKGNEKEYLITQYLTLMAQSNGYDGICFRSSLVKEGTNYVIFNATTCVPISSKMYVIPEITYSLKAVLNDQKRMD